MISPSEDRVDYADQLRPPTGYHLVRAVATTYSLDFETLIAAAFPLGAAADIEGDACRNPVAAMEALRSVVDKLVVFCEAGQIKLPKGYNRIYPLLERSIVQIKLPKDKVGFPSFHPKTWTLQYVNDHDRTDVRWRFIVMSRNLSTDESWDFSVSFEGMRRTGEYENTKRLRRFLEFLRRRSGGNDVVNDLIKDLDGVSFFAEEPFDGFEILPLGIQESLPANAPNIFRIPVCEGEKLDNTVKSHELLVVSPFLSGSEIAVLNTDIPGMKNVRRTLITRRLALNGLNPGDVSNFKCYVLRDPGGEGLFRDLHAKMFLRRKYGESELFVGSMNATTSGMYRNVEMMVGLHGPGSRLNTEQLLGDLCGGAIDGKGSPLELVESFSHVEPSDEEKNLQNVERILKEFCRTDVRVEVVAGVEEGCFDLHLHGKRGYCPEGVEIYPLPLPGLKCAYSEELVFRKIELSRLTSLFAVSCTKGEASVSRIVKLPLVGMPEDRDRAILNEVVKDRPALYRYLALLFSGVDMLGDGNGAVDGGNEAEAVDPLAQLEQGLYEQMLDSATRSPEKIAALGSLLSEIESQDPSLDELRGLYEGFARALGLKGKGGRHGSSL